MYAIEPPIQTYRFLVPGVLVPSLVPSLLVWDVARFKAGLVEQIARCETPTNSSRFTRTVLMKFCQDLHNLRLVLRFFLIVFPFFLNRPT